MRRSIDGLMAIIRDTYNMDPYANAVYLFCGKRHNTLKVLYFEAMGSSIR
jgi:transposase